jgi:class 3 adenylate cyclase
VKACQAALAMQGAAAALKNRWQGQGLPLLRIRIGIHSGPLVYGNVGSREPSITRAGDTVNLASRLEEVKNYTARNPPKRGGASTGGQTVPGAGIGSRPGEGPREPAAIYELLSETSTDKPELVKIFCPGSESLPAEESGLGRRAISGGAPTQASGPERPGLS